MSKQQTEIAWPTNIRIADVRKQLPFKDDSFDAVYASHVLEHLHRDEAFGLLKEAYRVLRPGGLCRMLVPDLRAIVMEYLGQGSVPGDVGVCDDPARRMCRRLLMRGESGPGGGRVYRTYTAMTNLHDHKWMYDGPSLVKLMAEAGFQSCEERKFRQSDIPHLDKVEAPGRFLEGAGVAAEGRKPVA